MNLLSYMAIPVAVIAVLLMAVKCRVRTMINDSEKVGANIVDLRFKHEPAPIKILTNSPYFERAFYRLQGLAIEQRGGSAIDIVHIQEREMDGDADPIMDWIRDHPMTPELKAWIDKRNADKKTRP